MSGRTFVLADTYLAGVEWCREAGVDPHSPDTRILTTARDARGYRLSDDDYVGYSEPGWRLMRAWKYVEATSERKSSR